jgi:hypothetical protein
MIGYDPPLFRNVQIAAAVQFRKWRDTPPIVNASYRL